MKGDGSINKTTDKQGRHRLSVQLFVPGRRWPIRRQLDPCTHRAKDAHECQPCWKAAEKAQRDLQAARTRGELEKKEKTSQPEALPTVGEWMQRWGDNGCVGGRRGQKAAPGPSTQRMYRDLIRLDIAPSALARLRLDEVRRRHVKDYLDDRATAGRAEATLTTELGAMARAWRDALEWYEDELSERANPFDVGIPETKAKREARALDVHEIRTLLDQVAEHRLLAAWVRLGIDCGARPSELSALEWADLDLEATPATATITKTIVWEPRPEKEPGEGKYIPRESDGKTGQGGWRKVTLSPSTVEVLAEHRKTMRASALAVVGFWPKVQDGLDLTNRVFRSDAGKLTHFASVRQQLQLQSKKAGIGKVVPYDLRHTAATLIDECHDDVTASKALGHASSKASATTRGYIHRRRLPLVDSACLDLALSKADDQADDQPRLRVVGE